MAFNLCYYSEEETAMEKVMYMEGGARRMDMHARYFLNAPKISYSFIPEE